MALVTFDFHDTLAHNDPWFQLEILALPGRVAGDLALDLAPETLAGDWRDLRRSVTKSGIEIDAYDGVERVFRVHGINVSREDLVSAVDAAMRDVLAHSRAVAGVLDTVAALRADGHRLGVISSAVHHQFLEWTLGAFGVLEVFDFVLSSARAGFYKSDPRIYHRALELGGVDASHAVHIGDSLRWDVRAASRVGMRTIWLDHGRAQEPVDASPHLTVTAFDGQLDRIRDVIARDML